MQTAANVNRTVKITAVLAFALALCVAVLSYGGLASAGAPATSSAAKVLGKIEPRVLQDTASGKSTSFVVLTAQQADLSKAYGMKDQDARGWYVYNTLKEHAAKSQAGLRAMLDSRGIAYKSFWAASMLVVTGDRTLVETLAARDDVRAIESNRPTRWIEEPEVANQGVVEKSPSAPSAVEWGVQNVNAPQVWAMGFTGQGIVVGNQDTGIRWSHNGLKPKYRGWDGATANHNFNWWDAIHSGGGSCGANTTVPCDDNGHGTHTMGTSVGDDGAGNQVGVAPGAKWIGCRNMNVGAGTPATYTECFQFFIAPTDLAGGNANPALRPHVMNNSWGCPPSEGCSATSLQTIVENTQAAGIFVEVSAGNAGSACSTVNDPPAIYAASFSTGSYNIGNILSTFSSRGPVTVDSSNRRKPDISAPGENVRSTTRTSDTSYGNLSGTSMAGPHVVGVVALLWSAHPSLNRMITETKTILQNTANPNVIVASGSMTCGGIPSSTIPNNHFGYGRVDALAAVNSVTGGTVTPVTTGTAVATGTSTAVAATGTPCAAVSVWTFGPTYTPGVYAIQGGVAGDGNFYVAGGQMGNNTPVPNVNRYNTASNTFTALPNLPVAVGQAAVGASGTKVYVAGGYLGGTTAASVTSTLQIFDTGTNTWTFGPPMPAPKEAAAGVVANGKFYVIGGDDFNATVATNYVYDIAGNSWSVGTPLPAGRTNTNATAVGNIIYLFGGAIGAGFTADDSLLSFNTGTNTWTTLAPAGVTGLGNYGGISTFGAGKLIVTVGGSTNFVSSNRSRIYDIAGNSWTEGPALNESRMGHAQGTLSDGKVIVVSGLNSASATRTTTELLPSAGGPCPTSTVPTVIATSTSGLPTLTVVPSITGVASVTAGATATCVPVTAGWTQGPVLPVPLVRAWGVYFPPNGKFYAMGGRTADAAGNAQRNPLEYTPSTNTWVTKTAVFSDQLTSNMLGGVLTMSGTPVIVMVGGSEGGGTVGTTEVRSYNPVTDQMTTLASDPWTPGSTTIPGGVAIANNKLYILGGFIINVGMSDDIWEFDPAMPAGSRWVQKSAVLPQELGYIPATTIGGIIYTGGGSSWDGTTLQDSDFAFRYDPVADTITTVASLPAVTAETRAVTVNGEMWVLGGGRNAPNPSSNVQIYNPTTNTWRSGPSFVLARRNFPADTDGAGNIYLAGGYAPTAPTDNMEIYRQGNTCGTPSATVAPATNTASPTLSVVPGTATRTSTSVASATSVSTSVATGTSTTGVATGTAVSTTVPPTATVCPVQFSDVPANNTFYSQIRCLACRGIIGGYSDGTFRPNNDVTRGQLSKIVANSAGFNEPVTGQTFEDVPPTHTFYQYIERMANRGIVGGYPCGGPFEPCGPENRPYFRPNANATRGQISKIVSEAAGFEDIPEGQTYQDVPPSNTFYVWIERLTSRGIMSGYPCGTVPSEPCGTSGKPYFRPNNNATRGQTSKIVANTFFPGCVTPSQSSKANH